MTDLSQEPSKTMNSEETSPSSALDPTEPTSPSEAAPAASGRTRHTIGLTGPLVAAGFTILAVGGIWLWQQQRNLAARLVVHPVPIVSVDPARVTALENEVADLTQRLGLQERRPIAAPVDLGPMQMQVAQLAARLDARQDADGTASQAADARVAALEGKLQGLETRLATAERQEQMALARAGRAAALAGAAQALAAGRPLGAIPDAPPALARFATVAPPTEAALRLAFPVAAVAAEQASRPAAELSFGQRMLQRVEGLVTVRQGEQVLVGAPASGVLAEARTRLDAGDLAGTVATLDRLDAAAAAALAGWRAQAQALLDARAALATMAVP